MIALQRSRLLTMLLILTVLSSIALRTFPASAQPNYSPGVKPGDSITYGEFSINGTTPYPPFPANISSIKIQIQSVNTQTSTVNASLVYSYKNGTQSTQSLSGNTVTGQGNLFPYLVAGNLTAGDLLFNSPYPYYPYVFNATVERVYGGALRSVNLFNITLTNPGQFVQAQFYWDVQTGFLLDAAEHVNYPGQSFSIHFKATDTNVWTPNTSPDYSLDASALSSDVIHRGESTSFRLDLTSLNGFSGNVGFALGVFAPNNMQPPGAMVTPTDVPLSAGNSANALVTVSFNSTTSLGQYVILVNGTSGPINHQARLLVAAAPPDFIVEANPPNMTIFQGTSKTSIIIVTGRGGFTGTVFLELITQPPFGTFVTSTLRQTSVTINSTVTSGTSILTVSALNSQPGLTSVGLNAYSGILYRTLYIPVNVTGPDFRITATPASLTMRQGDTGESIITLTSVLGFSGLVNLSASLYGNISGSLSNTAMNVPADGQANSTLTITSFPSSPPGFASAYVTGSSFTGLSHSVYIQINVTGPDFRFQAGNYFFNLDPGQSANSTLTLFSVEGFSGTISLSISTYGPIQAAVTPVEITLNSTQTAATAVLMVTALPASPSTYAQVDVRASSGNLVHDVYISLTVTGPDFSIMTNPYLLSIPQGGSGQATVSLSSIDNFSGNVTLSTSSSLTATISSNPVTLSPGGTTITTLTIQVPLNTSPGNYFIQITATSASLFHYSSIEVYVIGPDFLLTASPSYLTIPQAGNTTSTVTVTSLDTLEGTVSISVYTIGPITVSPFNATLTLSRNSTATMSLQISASPGLTPGIYDAIITASLGSVLHSTGITVQVVGPDFSFYALPSSLALTPGQTGTSTLHLNSLMGFGGNVTLSVFSNGLNATLSDTTLALPSGGSASTDVTIQAPSDASPSNYYYVTVQASSGTITHTLSIFVQIIAPDFTIIPNPFQLTIQAGTSAQSTLQLTSINGFNGTVSLTSFPSVFGNFTSPIAATLSASKVTLTSGGSASVVLNITATAEAAGENFYIQVEATSGTMSRTVFVQVRVTGASLGLTASPIFMILNPGSSGNSTITLTGSGFSGTISLSAFSFPSGLTTNLNPTRLTLNSTLTSATSELTITAPADVAPGLYLVGISANSNGIIENTTIYVKV